MMSTITVVQYNYTLFCSLLLGANRFLSPWACCFCVQREATCPWGVQTMFLLRHSNNSQSYMGTAKQQRSLLCEHTCRPSVCATGREEAERQRCAEGDKTDLHLGKKISPPCMIWHLTHAQRRSLSSSLVLGVSHNRVEKQKH